MNIAAPLALIAAVLPLAAASLLPAHAAQRIAVATDPAPVFAEWRQTVHRDNDDLLTAGPGVDGLRVTAAPVFADPARPSAELPRALAERALAAGIDVFGGYGMSETCPLLTLAQLDSASLDDPALALERRTRAGIPVPLVELRIVDEAMADVAHDGVATGEVVVRAPWLTEAYLQDEAASAALWSGGYLHTGDIGNIDSGGYLRVTDRIKDVIKTGGEWISSLALEDIIAQHPAVSEVAVIGVADPKWGERPLPLVVVRPGHALAEAEIIALLTAHSQRGDISRYAIPEQVQFVDAIARTSVGKINKKALRSLHEDRPASTAPPRNQ